MADQTKQQHLRLVASPPTEASRPKAQPELLVGQDRDALWLFWLTPARLRQFAQAIDSTRPRYVFDLRVLPSFDGAGVTRRSMFRLMEAAGCCYVDVMGRVGHTDRRNGFLELAVLEDCVRSVCGAELVGPMFFLCQSREELSWSSLVLPELLRPAPRAGWSVHVVGAGTAKVIDASPRVQPWEVGETLFVVASPSESTGWLLDGGGRPAEPINLPRGSSVRVAKLQVGRWTDVEVLGGPYRGRSVRLASNAHVARLVK